MSKNDSKDYEVLYKNLKEEYDQSKIDNDELFKEYESTIQILTESVNLLKNEKNELLSKITKLENEQKQLKKEKENLQKKNKEKIIDLQCLNQEKDKLYEMVKKVEGEKSLCDKKIVILENDIEHCQNKIRENEDCIEELKLNLENALEENITLQTEFETYKLNIGEELIRKDEEYKDVKTDLVNKDKIIQKLKKLSNKIDIQNIQNKLKIDIDGIQTRRRTVIDRKRFKKENIKNEVNKKVMVSYKTSQKLNNEEKTSENKEEKKEEGKNIRDNLNSEVRKNFGKLFVSEQDKIFINKMKNNNCIEEQLKQFKEELLTILSGMQNRKNKLRNDKKNINEILEKIFYR